MNADVETTARAWLAAEPDEDCRAELRALLDDPAELASRFGGRLQFGTAGLRAAIGAGPLRMNRLVVRQAAAGLIAYLLREVPDAATRGIVIGYDARHKSDAFALDTARVAAAAGVRAMLLPRPLPTPVLAWNITDLGAAAGVMVTASHNPPADNGYKVYLGTGAQIVPPADVDISTLIDEFDATTVALAEPDDPLIERLDESPLEAYLAAVPDVRRRPDLPGVPVAYTAMHGVGGETLLRAFERAGWLQPAVVAEQQQPDPDFPTVAFPNPEEPGAMDLLLATAESSGAVIALANDPDADRLGAAIPIRAGGWRRLTGDEIGCLLADHLLASTEGDDRVVITTLVSSSLLARMAEAAGVHHAETFTGFKWIAHEVLSHPEWRFVLGYEQALGYLVAGRPLDKDGITAAVVLTEVAAAAVAAGGTVEDLLDDIASRFGRYVTSELSVRMDPVAAAATVGALQARPPAALGGSPVSSVQWFAEANLLRLMVDGPDGPVRAQIRPSGTEPKVKLYGEAVGADPAPFLADLAAALEAAGQDV